MPTKLQIDPALIPPPQALPPYARKTDFARVGAGFVETAAERGLKPDHRVLDLGCGVGRFAAAFAAYTHGRGRYEGLDASVEAIDTCNTYIAPAVDGFRFQVADVFNTHYRPDADQPAAMYRFPFSDASFDFVFSNSLFTHLAPRDLENYLREIGRVLAPGGRTLNTIFLLNAESVDSLKAGLSRQELPHEVAGGIARVKRLDRPEAVIAFDERFARRAHADAGLGIEEPIRYGSWSGRKSSGAGFGNKDIVVALREPGAGAAERDQQ
jgi:SAM-dependent methyltransferase